MTVRPIEIDELLQRGLWSDGESDSGWAVCDDDGVVLRWFADRHAADADADAEQHHEDEDEDE